MNQEPEVALVGSTVYVRWASMDPWVVLRDARFGPVVSEAAHLPVGAARLADPGWLLRDVRVGDIQPITGIVGNCPVSWSVHADSESWWLCSLSAGHEDAPTALPHIAASYSRVEAVLTAQDARQALLRGETSVRVTYPAALVSPGP